MRNKNWVFGTNCALSFSPNPMPSSTPPLNTYEGCATISDVNGNLLLYSDGVTVRDGSGTIRASGLQGNQSSSQAALIVPDPGNKDQYYVFTSDGTPGGGNHVNGILINVLTWVSTPLSTLMTMPPTAKFSSTEKLIAIRHSNKRDYWVLTVVQPKSPIMSPIGLGALRVFLVTPTNVSYVGDQGLNQNVSDVGYMKASESGKRIAIASMFYNNVLVIPFSNSTGLLNLPGLINLPVKVPPFNTNGYVYGVEFSPNGRLVYYSTLFPLPIASSPNTDGHVFQYLLPNGPLIRVGTHANDKAGDFALGALQLGSDGRIYIAQDGEKALGVIAQPDTPGMGCNLTFSAVPLAAGSTCNAGLPNMIRDLF